MAEYLAVIRVTPGTTSRKLNFSADNVKDAVNKVLHYTRRSSTADLHEYEVLEVVPGGYKPVAVKESFKGTKVSHVVVADFAVRPAPPAAEETAYAPYTVAIT